MVIWRNMDLYTWKTYPSNGTRTLCHNNYISPSIVAFSLALFVKHGLNRDIHYLNLNYMSSFSYVKSCTKYITIIHIIHLLSQSVFHVSPLFTTVEQTDILTDILTIGVSIIRLQYSFYRISHDNWSEYPYILCILARPLNWTRIPSLYFSFRKYQEIKAFCNYYWGKLSPPVWLWKFSFHIKARETLVLYIILPTHRERQVQVDQIEY